VRARHTPSKVRGKYQTVAPGATHRPFFSQKSLLSIIAQHDECSGLLTGVLKPRLIAGGAWIAPRAEHVPQVRVCVNTFAIRAEDGEPALRVRLRLGLGVMMGNQPRLYGHLTLRLSHSCPLTTR
jgi:hypothetical protein